MKKVIFLMGFFGLFCSCAITVEHDDTDGLWYDPHSSDPDSEAEEDEGEDTEVHLPPECPTDNLIDFPSIEKYKPYDDNDVVVTEDGWGLYYYNYWYFNPYYSPEINETEINLNKMGTFYARYHTPSDDRQYFIEHLSVKIFPVCYDAPFGREEWDYCAIKNAYIQSSNDGYRTIEWDYVGNDLEGASDDESISWKASPDFKEVSFSAKQVGDENVKIFSFSFYLSNITEEDLEVEINKGEDFSYLTDMDWFFNGDFGIVSSSFSITVPPGSHQRLDFSVFSGFNEDYSGSLNFDFPEGIIVNEQTDPDELWVETKMPFGSDGYNWITMRREFTKIYDLSSCSGISWEMKIFKPSPTGLRWSIYDVDADGDDEAWWNDEFGRLDNESGEWQEYQVSFEDFYQDSGIGVRANDFGLNLGAIKSFEFTFLSPEIEESSVSVIVLKNMRFF